MKSGVYAIVNRVTGECYVGSSKHLTFREARHFHALSDGIHHNRFLQQAFSEYDSINFLFHILEECPVDQLPEREQLWINRLAKHTYLYNIETVVRRPEQVQNIQPVSEW